LLLAWAAAFATFASDGREGRSSGSMVPVLAGMQALTNAFFLPYLVLRAPEGEGGGNQEGATSPKIYPVVYKEDLSQVEQACESKWLGVGVGAWGALAIGWGLWARSDQWQFGGSAFTARLASLTDLLSTDRVGTSFVVDLVLFALFQVMRLAFLLFFSFLLLM